MRIKTFIASTLFALAIVATPHQANAGVFVSVNLAPPPLPIYEQPPIPGDGYIWTPGYWGYGPGGYYWIPGEWVMAPQVGFLWTPGYWGWGDGVYAFHEGYWGPHVGFYGGINYGFGYTGVGYAGGLWVGGAFRYNHAVNNFGSVHVRNVYNAPVAENRGARTSFNGGNGGVQARANAAEQNAARDRHVAATGAQTQRMQTASRDRAQLASENHGRPANAAGNGNVAQARAQQNANRPQQNQARALENQPAKPSPLGRDNAQMSARGQQQRAQQQQARAQQQQHEQRAAQPQQREQPQQRAEPFAGKPAPQQHQDFHQERPAPQARPEPAARPAAPQHEGGHEGGHERR